MEEKRQISHMGKCPKKLVQLFSTQGGDTELTLHELGCTDGFLLRSTAWRQGNRVIGHWRNVTTTTSTRWSRSASIVISHVMKMQNILQKAWSALPSLSKTRNFWEMATDKGKLRNPEQSMSRRISDGSMSHGILAGSMSWGILDGTLQQNTDIR